MINAGKLIIVTVSMIGTVAIITLAMTYCWWALKIIFGG